MNYIVKLDASQFSEDINESIVVLNADKIGYETNPFSIIANVTDDYKEIMGNNSRVIIYNESLQGNHSAQIEELKTIAQDETLTSLMYKIRDGNITIYPESPIVTCAKKCPEFILNRYLN